MKLHQRDVNTFLTNDGMSAQGLKLFRSSFAMGFPMARESPNCRPRTAAILDGLETDLYIAAGHCINF